MEDTKVLEILSKSKFVVDMAVKHGIGPRGGNGLEVRAYLVIDHKEEIPDELLRIPIEIEFPYTVSNMSVSHRKGILITGKHETRIPGRKTTESRGVLALVEKIRFSLVLEVFKGIGKCGGKGLVIFSEILIDSDEYLPKEIEEIGVDIVCPNRVGVLATKDFSDVIRKSDIRIKDRAYFKALRARTTEYKKSKAGKKLLDTRIFNTEKKPDTTMRRRKNHKRFVSDEERVSPPNELEIMVPVKVRVGDHQQEH